MDVPPQQSAALASSLSTSLAGLFGFVALELVVLVEENY